MDSNGLSAVDFFRLLYPSQTLLDDVPSYLSLWNRHSGASEHVPTVDPERAARVAVGWSELGQDAYYGVALRSADLGPYKRGSARNTCAIPGLWLDVDIAGPAHAAQDLPPSAEAALEALTAGLPFEASILVDSGYGLHLYWLFETQVFYATAEQREKLTKLSKFFNKRVAELFERRGWKLDDTSDLARVLRIPGTRNHKQPVPRPVIGAASGARHALEDIQAWAIRPRGRPRKDAFVVSANTTDDGALRPEGPGLPRDELVRRLLTLREDRSREVIAPVLEGRPFAAEGRRDVALQVAASVIAFVDPDAPPETLAELFRPSLVAMAAEADSNSNPCPTLDDAADKLRRAQADARRKRTESRAANERIAQALRRRRIGRDAGASADIAFVGRGVNTSTDGTADASTQSTETDSGKDETATDDDPARGYTPEQVARWATEQGVSPEGFARRWIIQIGPSYYLFRDGRYCAPVTRESLPLALRQDLARAPIEWAVPMANGGYREKKPTELVLDYGTCGRYVTADLTISRSYYDAESETFHEAACPLRAKLEPRYDPLIAGWLEVLGGVEVEKLLDWLATVTRLDHQSCALYLSGPPATGKSMLAYGSARLWREGGPTELARVLAQWNTDLADCPLVIADEQIPQLWKGQKTSSELRLMLGTSSRTLTRKYLPNATLKGAIRLMLLANNDRMLQFGDEEVGAEDLEAVAGRFLHIVVSQDAASYLRSIGGRSATEGWVDNDGIARHLLWLRETRTVSPGKRFLVEGRITQMHRLLATQGRVSSLLSEWLACYLNDPKPEFKQDKLLLSGNGRLLVNTSAIAKHWGTYINEKVASPPTTTMIGRVLRNLSRRGAPVSRIGTLRYHDIDPDHAFTWAERFQVGDLDRMRTWLERVEGADAPPKERASRQRQEPGDDDVSDDANIGAIAHNTLSGGTALPAPTLDTSSSSDDVPF